MIYTITLNPAIDKELLVPKIEVDQVLRAESIRIDFGGKGFNVSRMLKALGSPSTALGFLGGKTGEILQTGLHHLDIRTDFIQVAGETRTNISIMPSDHMHYIKVNEPGPTIDKEEKVKLINQLKRLIKPEDWCVLAGSLPLGISPDFYSELIKIIQGVGAFAVLDASGEPLLHGCKQKAFLVKPNAEEAQKLTGISIKSIFDAQKAGLNILTYGVQNVVLSLGKLGALWLTENETWSALSPKIVERNPIGAGDSLVAGIVWGLSQQLPVQDCLRWGVACGAAAASLDGTAVGEYDYIVALMKRIKLDQVR
jgi:1-phosphofructokinase family hexose kinase